MKNKKDCIVYYNNIKILKLNEDLLTKQNAWDNLDLIKNAHIKRVNIEMLMENTDDIEELALYFKRWTKIQFELQELWKFKKDAIYHKFWTVPKCTCPKLDNEDRYPCKFRIISTECPIHVVKKEKL